MRAAIGAASRCDLWLTSASIPDDLDLTDDAVEATPGLWWEAAANFTRRAFSSTGDNDALCSGPRWLGRVGSLPRTTLSASAGIVC